MQRRLSIALALLTLVALVLRAPGSAQAQKTTLSAEVIKAHPDSATISRQLRMASEIGHSALQGLQSLPADDSTPIDRVVLQKAADTYVLIRAAKESLELKIDRLKSPDPLVEIPYRRVVDAWNLARTPVDKASWSMVRQEYLTLSIRDLHRSLQLVDQALVLLP